MSKMSQLHAELSEQAYELGFESIGEAEQAGYGVDWENAKLIKVGDEQEKAHEAWLKKRDNLLERLDKATKEAREIKDHELADFFEKLYLFIKEGEV